MRPFAARLMPRGGPAHFGAVSAVASLTPRRFAHSWLNPIIESDISALRSLVHSSSVDPAVLATHNTDWMKQYHGSSPLVLYPKTTEEVAAALRYCNEKKIGVVPQGGNTGLVGGSVPTGADEIVLSMKGMNRILSFDPSSGVLVCEAGCILEVLDNFLASQHRHCMPLDLGAKGSCMIGGNVSTNAGGLRFLRYGSLHGSVLGLEVVTAQGETLDLLSSLKKDNSSGFPLKHLFIGSEGCLGVITKVAIQTVVKPPQRQVAMLMTDSFEKAANTATLARRKLSEVLSAVEVVDGQAMSLTMGILHGYKSTTTTAGPGSSYLQLPEGMRPLPMDSFLASLQPPPLHKRRDAPSSPFYVVIEAGGANPEHDNDKLHRFLEEAMSPLSSSSSSNKPLEPLVSDGTVAMDEKQANFLWRLREEVSVALSQRGHVFKYDLSFASPQEMYKIVNEARDVVARVIEQASTSSQLLTDDDDDQQLSLLHQVAAVGYGHLGDGNIHLNVSCPTRWPKTSSSPSYHSLLLDALEPWVLERTIELKGSISAEHGLGQAKGKYLRQAVKGDPAVFAHLLAMKRSFDPRGILNPGKVIVDGPHAEPLA